MANKEKYRQLCEVEKSIPLFSQSWWLDAVCGDGWDVCLVEKNEQVLASMPYVVKRKRGFVTVSQPPLTQNLGPWIRNTNAKHAQKNSREKKLMGLLIDQLPKFARFSQNWHFSRTNWLPFYWRGFSQTTNYTYRLESISNENEIWSGFRQNIRTDIKKATNRCGVRVRTDLGIKEFLTLNTKVFSRQGKPVPYTAELVHGLDIAAADKNCRKIFIAEDTDGQKHAAIYLVWDETCAYYLMGGGDPKLRNSGATSLCLWEAIRFASTVTKSFDFEGSMIEPVERFFRSFGAVQTPYHNISRTPSLALRLGLVLKGL